MDELDATPLTETSVKSLNEENSVETETYISERAANRKGTRVIGLMRAVDRERWRPARHTRASLSEREKKNGRGRTTDEMKKIEAGKDRARVAVRASPIDSPRESA